MIFHIPQNIYDNIKRNADETGIEVDSLIKSALHFYFSEVSDTHPSKVGFSTSETAKQLGYSTKTILRLVAKGLLSPLPDSTRRYIFSRTEIDRYVADAADRSPAKKCRPSKRRGGHTRR